MLSKKKKVLINCFFCLTSFTLSSIIFMFILQRNNFYPFGNLTLFSSDMKDQYMPFFASLRYLGKNCNSLLFSWSKSMGNDYVGLYSYYLASPLSWITVLFPLDKLPLAIFFISTLKIGLSALTFSIFSLYIKNKYHAVSMVGKKYSYCISVFSMLPLALAYSLTSYNMHYLLCLMWLDGIIMLPLILLGVEYILNKQKCTFFIICMTALLYFNYYTGYMVGIFSFIYIIIQLLFHSPRHNMHDILAAIKRYFFSGIISLGLASPILIPSFLGLVSNRLSMRNTSNELINCKLSTLFHQLITNGAVVPFDEKGNPHVYCGYFVLFLVIIFFIKKSIAVSEKIGSFVFLTVMALSLCFKPLDLAWQCFTEPMWFYSRYSFLFCMVLLCIGLRTLCSFSYEDLAGKMSHFSVLLSSIFITASIIFTTIDLGHNGIQIFHALKTQHAYMDINTYSNFICTSAPLADTIRKSDSGLYRIVSAKQFTPNDPLLLGINGLSHYSSTYSKSINTFLGKMGFAQSWIWSSGCGSTSLTESLLGIKYVFTDTSMPGTYAYLSSNNGLTCYINPYTLEFAFSSPISDLSPDFNNANPFVNQNTFLNTIAGTTHEYFKECTTNYSLIDSTENSTIWNYTFTAESSDPIYIYNAMEPYSVCDIYANGIYIGSYNGVLEKECMYLGSFNPGETVTVSIYASSKCTSTSTYIASLNINEYTSTINYLKKGNISWAKKDALLLSGIVHVKNGELIMTSIPYSPNWHIKVDGKRIDNSSILSYANTFLVLKIPEGEHEITMYYIPSGFPIGIFIALIFILYICVYSILHRTKFPKIHREN